MKADQTDDRPFAEFAEKLNELGQRLGRDMGDPQVSFPRYVARQLRAWVQTHPEIQSIDDLLDALDPDTARKPWWKEQMEHG